MKQTVLLYGNCQGAWLSKTLNRDPRVQSEFDMVFLPSYGEIPADHPIHRPNFLSTCSWFLFQVSSDTKLPACYRSLPKTCRKIGFPLLSMKLFWPLHTLDPRNNPEPSYPLGRYPYGDRLVLRLLEQGTAPRDVATRYCETNLRQFIDLDRYAEICFAELQLIDRKADIALAPVIERGFRTNRFFGTINHPSVELLTELTAGLLSALLDVTPLTVTSRSDGYRFDIGDLEIPLHPQIIQHFGLTWATPEIRYRYLLESLTTAEYLHAYASFRPVLSPY